MGRHLATISFILKLEFDNNLLMIISLKLTGSLAWVLNSVIEETSFKKILLNNGTIKLSTPHQESMYVYANHDEK